MTNYTNNELDAFDEETRVEFLENIKENFEDILETIECLYSESTDEKVHALFRHIHSLKGNLAMIQLEPFVNVLHILEEMTVDMRDKRCDFHDNIGDYLFNSIGAIQKEFVMFSKQESISLEQLTRLFKIAKSVNAQPIENRNNITEAAAKIVNQVNGLLDEFSSNSVFTKSQANIREENQSLDAIHALIAKENTVLYKRTVDMVRLCLEFNEELGTLVDNRELEIAIYIHNFLLPNIGFKRHYSTPESDEDKALILHHCQLASDLAPLLSDCTDAIIILKHHHEIYNGEGVPGKVSGSAIHVGAVVLAIVDQFNHLITDSPQKSYKEKLIQAITTLNKLADIRFRRDYIDVFNRIIKKNYIRD